MIKAILTITLVCTPLLAACGSPREVTCNDPKVMQSLLDNTFLKGQKTLLAGLKSIDNSTARQSTALISSWTYSFFNIRQRNFDSVNNVRECVTDVESHIETDIDSFIKTPDFPWASISSSAPDLDLVCLDARSIVYKIERPLDKPDNFYLTWVCN